MTASLMMYARPELAAAHDRYWHLIRRALDERGIAAPKALSQPTDLMAHWCDPALVFSQTCGMPYRRFLHDKVALVGTPDFGLPGCEAGYYRSIAVVRADVAGNGLRDFAQGRLAYNESGSQSGFAAAYSAARASGFWFGSRIVTGGHLHSARAVAEGRADIAFLDAVTWRLIQRYEPFAKDLRVLDETEPTPGLPYITGLVDQAAPIREAVRAAIATLDVGDRDLLGIRALIDIPKEAYLAIPDPPENAA